MHPDGISTRRRKMANNPNDAIEKDTYDRGIVPAETAARKDREEDNYKETPDAEGSIDTTGGYTVDQEGLANNYAIEPEMYYDTPGDRADVEAQEQAERVQEMKEARDGGGGKGPGLV